MTHTHVPHEVTDDEQGKKKTTNKELCDISKSQIDEVSLA